MKYIKIILGKLGSGILYGAGFFIGLAVIGSIAMPYFEAKMDEGSEERMASMFIEYDETAKPEAEVTSEKIGNGEFTLIGKLSNNGENTWSSTTLKAELYDESGAFIEECDEYVRQTSKPGSVINFKLSCGSKCSKLQIEKYSSYKLVVIDAHHKR